MLRIRCSNFAPFSDPTRRQTESKQNGWKQGYGLPPLQGLGIGKCVGWEALPPHSYLHVVMGEFKLPRIAPSAQRRPLDRLRGCISLWSNEQHWSEVISGAQINFWLAQFHVLPRASPHAALPILGYYPRLNLSIYWTSSWEQTQNNWHLFATPISSHLHRQTWPSGWKPHGRRTWESLVSQPQLAWLDTNLYGTLLALSVANITIPFIT